jgi:hypothetical protein
MSHTRQGSCWATCPSRPRFNTVGDINTRKSRRTLINKLIGNTLDVFASTGFTSINSSTGGPPLDELDEMHELTARAVIIEGPFAETRFCRSDISKGAPLVCAKGEGCYDMDLRAARITSELLVLLGNLARGAAGRAAGGNAGNSSGSASWAMAIRSTCS